MSTTSDFWTQINDLQSDDFSDADTLERLNDRCQDIRRDLTKLKNEQHQKMTTLPKESPSQEIAAERHAALLVCIEHLGRIDFSFVEPDEEKDRAHQLQETRNFAAAEMKSILEGIECP